MSNSYIRVEDMGMFFQGLRILKHYHDNRLKSINVRKNTVPADYNPINEYDISPSKFAADRATDLIGMSKVNYMLVMEHMAAAILEDADIRADFQALAMKVLLRQADNMHRSRKLMEDASRERELKQQRVIAENAELDRRANVNTTAFRKKIAEETELMQVRKRKLVRSITKALAAANNHMGNLSPRDMEAAMYLVAVDWVGDDNGVWRCKEQVIEDESWERTLEIVTRLLEIAKG